MRRVIVLVVVRRCPMMLVCSQTVMVLRMIVIGVCVGVQRRDLAGGRGQDQSEQYRALRETQPRVYVSLCPRVNRDVPPGNANLAAPTARSSGTVGLNCPNG